MVASFEASEFREVTNMFFNSKKEDYEYADEEFDKLLKNLAEEGPIFHDEDEDR